MIRIMKLGETPTDEIFSRNIPETDVEGVVSEIIKDVRQNGDDALYKYSKIYDGVSLKSISVSPSEISMALDRVDDEFINVLKKAAKNIRRFHEKQVRSDFSITEDNGIIIGQRVIPIEVAGLYVPGGTAAYPSSVLMNAIPAKIAGCREVIMTTPPGRDGCIPDTILAAAHIAGVDRIFKVGGAQAIAALAYGTKTIPKADKITGPGNAFVAEAKRQVFGLVSIDMIAGPSEILIVADSRSNPSYLAADLLSQAEHDKMASAVLITDSQKLAKDVQTQIESQLSGLERCEIARASIENNGKIIVAKDLPSAIEAANRIAPEHLELCTDHPFDYLGAIKNAGSVFLGRSCPEALGDYIAGPNHTLPTGGRARFSSPLSVDDFVKKSQYIYSSDFAFKDIAKDIAYFANCEGLNGHAHSAMIRLEDKKCQDF